MRKEEGSVVDRGMEEEEESWWGKEEEGCLRRAEECCGGALAFSSLTSPFVFHFPKHSACTYFTSLKRLLSFSKHSM